MSARYIRGSSVLAALILAAFVGGVVLSIHQIAQPSQPSLAYSAAADAPTPAQAGQCQEQDVSKLCATAIAQAKASSGKVTSSSPAQQSVGTDCVAVVKTADPAYKSTNGYKCVGKSAQVGVLDNGTLNIGWQANPNVAPGICKLAACQKTSTGNSSIKCAPVEQKCINKDVALAALSGPTAFTADRTGLGMLLGKYTPTSYDGFTPTTPLDKSTNDLLNAALGRDPNDTSGQINLDANKNIAAPTDQTLQQLAASNPDQSAQDASRQTTDAAFQGNSNLSDKKQDVVPNQQAPESPGILQSDGKYHDQYGRECQSATSCPAPPKNDTTFTPQGPCQNGGNLGNGCKLPGGTGPGTGGPSDVPNGGGGGLGGGLSSALGSFLKGLMPGLMNALFAPQAPQAACTSDSNAYNQALQQYQQQMYQYNQQLQQYNYQSQIASYQGYPTPPRPTPPSQPCYSPSGGGSSGPSGPSDTPVAQISCSPQTADVGQAIAISFSCGNSSSSAGSGFDTGGALSGSASTTISSPPAGATAATYSLQCRNASAVVQSQCNVQITRPSIILVANPKVVAVNASSTIGWVTSGMQSCVVSSPDSQQFTAQNATNNSVNGAAVTPSLASSARFVLNCTTTGGQNKTATTTVQVGAPGGAQGAIAVQSSADGASIARGDTVDISWDANGAASGSHIELWLFDAGLQTEYALIQSDLSTSGTYSWVTPDQNASCPANTPYVCYADLVPGRSYAIEADLYTGASTSPTFIDYGFAPQNFTVSQ